MPTGHNGLCIATDAHSNLIDGSEVDRADYETTADRLAREDRELREAHDDLLAENARLKAEARAGDAIISGLRLSASAVDAEREDWRLTAQRLAAMEAQMRELRAAARIAKYGATDLERQMQASVLVEMLLAPGQYGPKDDVVEGIRELTAKLNGRGAA